jgi:hypothetical protein
VPGAQPPPLVTLVQQLWISDAAPWSLQLLELDTVKATYTVALTSRRCCDVGDGMKLEHVVVGAH